MTAAVKRSSLAIRSNCYHHENTRYGESILGLSGQKILTLHGRMLP